MTATAPVSHSTRRLPTPRLLLPVGGFRHSDTVVVTKGGMELLTDYPSDIESLTIPV